MMTNAWICMSMMAISLSLQAQSERPNLIVILADDLGYGDLSSYDGWIQTPHLDTLAAEGVRFTDFHSSGPVCTPTRAGLLTGRYQQRADLEYVLYAPPEHPMQNRDHGLDPAELTFADVLRVAGYATGVFGKWHLGYERRYNPIHHGFDRFRGYVSGNVDFFSKVDGAAFYDWWSGDQLINEHGYVTHLITQHAVRFIEDHHDRPFVLYVAHEAPHYPYQGPNDEPFRLVGKRVPEVRDSAQVKRAYREMVEEMDTGIGEIIATLKRLDLDENTLVLFLSDNGAVQYGSNGPLRGFKSSLWEGGHRVPAFAWWPGRIEGDRTSDQFAISLDVMPTLLDAARVDLPEGHELDGQSLLPVLLDETALGERTLFWRYGDQKVVRQGSWKLIIDGRGQEGTALYNLADDLAETTDLAQQEPERVNDLLERLQAWEADVTPDP